jgi:hypothetical protein
VIGMFIHFVRVPFLFVGHRPPQNYFHAILGLVILAMAGYQVRLLRCYCYHRTPVSSDRWGIRFIMESTRNGPL